MGADFGSEQLSEISEEVQQAIGLIETALDPGRCPRFSRGRSGSCHRGAVRIILAYGELVFGDENRSRPAACSCCLIIPALCCRHDRVIALAALAAQTDTETPVVVDIYPPTLESGAASEIASEMAGLGRIVGFRPHGLDISATRSRGGAGGAEIAEGRVSGLAGQFFDRHCEDAAASESDSK